MQLSNNCCSPLNPQNIFVPVGRVLHKAACIFCVNYIQKLLMCRPITEKHQGACGWKVNFIYTLEAKKWEFFHVLHYQSTIYTDKLVTTNIRFGELGRLLDLSLLWPHKNSSCWEMSYHSFNEVHVTKTTSHRLWIPSKGQSSSP